MERQQGNLVSFRLRAECQKLRKLAFIRENTVEPQAVKNSTRKKKL